jgi:uncharacterized protein YcgI (DUF1989 family)
MMTILNDTVSHRPSPGGGVGHDCLYARCNDKIWEIASGQKNHPNCQDNLADAIESFKLTPFHVHDAFNLFQKSGVDPKDGRLYFEKTDANAGDYVDLYAEMDLIVACSSCPAGDGSQGLRKPIVYGIVMEIHETKLR